MGTSVLRAATDGRCTTRVAAVIGAEEASERTVPEGCDRGSGGGACVVGNRPRRLGSSGEPRAGTHHGQVGLHERGDDHCNRPVPVWLAMLNSLFDRQQDHQPSVRPLEDSAPTRRIPRQHQTGPAVQGSIAPRTHSPRRRMRHPRRPSSHRDRQRRAVRTTRLGNRRIFDAGRRKPEEHRRKQELHCGQRHLERLGSAMEHHREDPADPTEEADAGEPAHRRLGSALAGNRRNAEGEMEQSDGDAYDAHGHCQTPKPRRSHRPMPFRRHMLNNGVNGVNWPLPGDKAPSDLCCALP